METVKINSLIRSLNPVTGCPYDCDYCYARKVNNRYKVIPDFSDPQFFEQRIRKLYARKPTVFFLTSMSDFSVWKPEWTEKVLRAVADNPHSEFLLLTKRPELISLDSDLENLWVGVTVTDRSDLGRIATLRRRARCRNYFLTFEPLFEDLGELDLDGIGWIVVGTETGNRKGKVSACKDWIASICRQAKERDIPVFMKESLAAIVGEDSMTQDLPPGFTA